MDCSITEDAVCKWQGSNCEASISWTFSEELWEAEEIIEFSSHFTNEELEAKIRESEEWENGQLDQDNMADLQKS